ncbi:MAG: phosphate/phosphite/phosphonate ABC transporter substrate-binding protein [Desulfobulbaceae bacterium]|nr:phosphate/phosphite/phosphonate ABC transporter substrate-binding protein [Desulfobulbaceae bacterium]
MARQFFREKPVILALTILISLFLLHPVPVRAQSERLLIGLIPEMNIFKQKQRFRLLGEYLANKTGVPVEFTILTRYGNIIESFTTEKMDGAFFGSFTGALAIGKLGVVPLARPVNLDGSSTYHGLLLVRKNSGIASAAAMRGKRMAFVDKATTAGYLFPLAYLKEQGINAGAGFFSETFFTGSHDAAIIAVLDGKADIGAAKNSVYARIEKENPRVTAELKVVARSPAVPSNGLCVRADLPLSLKGKLKKALLDLEADPAGQAVLAEFGAQRFIETTALDYQPVFDMATKAGIDIKQYSYRNE